MLEIKNISCSIVDSDIQILNDLSLTIKEGEKIDSSIIKDAEDMDNISQKEEYALGTLDLFDSMISAES